MQKKVIFDIPQNREKSFGTTGKMLLSCLAAVSTLIHKIPTNKFITTDFLRKQLIAPSTKIIIFLTTQHLDKFTFPEAILKPSCSNY